MLTGLTADFSPAADSNKFTVSDKADEEKTQGEAAAKTDKKSGKNPAATTAAGSSSSSATKSSSATQPAEE